MRKLSYLIIVCLCLCSGGIPLMARQVTAFNTGWQFKKGPFATDPMRAASQWDGKWETVEIPHTWNAMDMQVQSGSFYEGAGYYRKTQFFPHDLEGKRVFLRFEG